MTETQGDRELDVWLAEHLLGLTPCDEWEPGNMGSAGGPVLWKRCDHDSGTCYSSQVIGSMQGSIGGVPDLTSSGDGMLMVLSAMVRAGYRYTLDARPFVRFTRPGHRGPMGEARHISLPMAVALAAQKALPS